MNSRKALGRHRSRKKALPQRLAQAVSNNTGSFGRQAAVIAAASGLVVTATLPATAAEETQEVKAVDILPANDVENTVAVESASAGASDAITVPTVDRPKAEPRLAAAVAAAQNKVAAAPKAKAAAPVRATAAPPMQNKTVQQPAVQQPVSGAGARIAAAALAQLGVGQDCTALVTNSLRAVGINHHGWPASYSAVGSPVSLNALQPGDILIYNNHVAVYIGNGQAVHGGWNGGTTAIFSMHVPSGVLLSAVRV